MLLHMEELYESIKVLRDKDGIFIAVQHMLHGALDSYPTGATGYSSGRFQSPGVRHKRTVQIFLVNSTRWQ